MHRHSLPLSALRAFEAAARLGSFKAAADELAVTPTAISHQIRGLEQQIGASLFSRQVRRVTLTDAGAQLYPVLRDGFDAFQAALARLTQLRQRPRVVISATNAFTVKWLVPRMTRFRDSLPGIDLQLQASDEPVDLRSTAIDIAIRYGRGPYPGLITEALLADWFAPVANPRLGVRSVDDLARWPLICFDWHRSDPRNPTWERWFAEAGLAVSKSAGELRFSDEGHAIQAAVAGQGIALVSQALVAEELASGHLHQPFGPGIDGHTYHLAVSSERTLSASAQAVLDWLKGQSVADGGPPPLAVTPAGSP
ncbi:LysR substrate-binding domain-containing protein [Caballeronia sp. LZ043]|uniref:LysR substrate-binding domain-containing protein n=1 Tax=Caballeronia sp. LZ043 TaxID=3038569 RepID=UPI0028676651|nr:LysR substrate-binding domain-containing protein [Caballeronia sp. LZ043]MDR5825666.1 LysR substrate-binding domain-containing protein [Caballeronia sp. LZ043]